MGEVAYGSADQKSPHYMTSLDIKKIPNGIVIIPIIKQDSPLTAQFPEYSEEKGSITFAPFHVSSYKNLAKEIFALTVQIPPRLRSSELEDVIIMAYKDDGGLKYLEARPKPESKYDWKDISRVFARSYANTEPTSEGLWAWGQVVQSEGEYLCVECGYIENFKKGAIFPVCEVCLAGDPEGPSDIEKGHWQKL